MAPPASRVTVRPRDPIPDATVRRAAVRHSPGRRRLCCPRGPGRAGVADVPATDDGARLVPVRDHGAVAVKRLCAPTRKPVRVAPVRPSAAVTAGYQARLDREIAAMAASATTAVLATYRRKPPELAADESPAAAMRETVARLGRDWDARFRVLAENAGRKFVRDATGHADRSFAAALRKAGFTVKFDATRVTNDLAQAAITENVSLIKSIPSEYFTQIQSMVTAAAQVGGDLKMLADGLQHQFGVTRRRAVLIATDQSAKVVTAITKARQTELGIETARWAHSGGSREPRPDHVAFSRGQNGGPFYSIKEGALISGKRIWPGQLIRCKCVSISVVMPA